MTFSDVINLDIYTYKKLLRDAVIYRYEQTKEGREYLEKCWRLSQTKPNYKKLKEKYM